jgi:CRISPR-associated protein (TIGR02584 family)
VVGLSPQIVTETLHALIALNQPAFIPTQIEILTTAEGRAHTIAALLNPITGAFHSFCKDYEVAELSNLLKAEHILAIADQAGKPLEDIRTADDSGAAGDTIVARIRALTEDDDIALHGRGSDEGYTLRRVDAARAGDGTLFFGV